MHFLYNLSLFHKKISRNVILDHKMIALIGYIWPDYLHSTQEFIFHMGLLKFVLLAVFIGNLKQLRPGNQAKEELNIRVPHHYLFIWVSFSIHKVLTISPGS